nr:MAG TPA: hypothetical protein [Caudoviricetes sp.]
MRKTNMKIKENISFADKINAIEYIVASYFSFDDDGYIDDYTPYFYGIATMEAYVKYFFEGLEFDEGEYIYSSISEDDEVMDLIKVFGKENLSTITYIEDNVIDKVEFMKQKYLNDLSNKKDSLSNLLDALSTGITSFLDQLKPNEINEFMKKFNESGLTADNLVNSFLQSDFKKEKDKEVLDVKNEQIREFSKIVGDDKARQVLERALAIHSTGENLPN